jgi:hypothetical protein
VKHISVLECLKRFAHGSGQHLILLHEYGMETGNGDRSRRSQKEYYADQLFARMVQRSMAVPSVATTAKVLSVRPDCVLHPNPLYCVVCVGQ